MAGLNDDPVDVFLKGDAPSIPHSSSLISLKTHKFCSEPLSMVVIRDSSPTSSADLSIFPPSSHENLTPSSSLSDHQSLQQFSSSASSCDSPGLLINLEPQKSPLIASPVSPFLYPRSNSGPSSSEQFDSDPDGSLPQSPLSYPSSEVDLPSSPLLPVSAPPRWWGVALRIIRSKVGNLGSLFGGEGNPRSRGVWSMGNFGLTVAAVSVMWWLWLRERRRRRLQRRNSVGQLVQIMREKDEKIVQLLNQIAQLNELLIGRHKL
ncbi:unnamed protein product [Linum tenue]|uniref:Uncharacterized protein n=1 Tax=Linum tenue TaxID=586396 RepID=A0AAV0LIG3_9ROSI|nr:unnamed protein product [Linum tenue]